MIFGKDRSLYGFDIIRALASLRQQSTSISDIQFHRELTTLINRLRDAHTQYQGPWTQKGVVASLPFLVEDYGPTEDTTYVVSKVDRRAVKDKYFTEGVEITHWNGIPFGRALELHADVETGGDRIRGAPGPSNRSLSARWNMRRRRMKSGSSSISSTLWDKPRKIRLSWEGLKPMLAPNSGQKSLATRFRRSIHMGAEAVRRAKKYPVQSRFVEGGNRSRSSSRKEAKAGGGFCRLPERAPRNDCKCGKFGYLRIWSFDVDDDQAFIDAASAHCAGLARSRPHHRYQKQSRRPDLGRRAAPADLHTQYGATHQIRAARNQYDRRNGESRVQSRRAWPLVGAR